MCNRSTDNLFFYFVSTFVRNRQVLKKSQFKRGKWFVAAWTLSFADRWRSPNPDFNFSFQLSFLLFAKARIKMKSCALFRQIARPRTCCDCPGVTDDYWGTMRLEIRTHPSPNFRQLKKSHRLFQHMYINSQKPTAITHLNAVWLPCYDVTSISIRNYILPRVVTPFWHTTTSVQ
jgi:hypothetical protein